MPDNPAHPTDPAGLSMRCYARHPGTGETVMIIRGQLGYWPDAGQATPEQLNAGLPVPPTSEQVTAMLAGSMFGWAVRGPDPARVPATRHAATANPDTVIDWGWLMIASRQARMVSRRALLDVLDLPAREWRDEYDGRVPPEEAAAVALDEHDSVHGV